MIKKQCNKCKETKPLNEFYKGKAYKDGHLNTCKECSKKYKKEYREKNKDKNPGFYKDEYQKRLARNPDYNKKKYQKQKVKNPNFYKDTYQRQLERNPDFYKDNYQKQKAKNPNFNQEQYQKQKAKNPDFYKKKYQRQKAKNPNYCQDIYQKRLAKNPDFNKGRYKRVSNRKGSTEGNYFYILGIEDMVKVGITHNLNNRLKQYKTKHNNKTLSYYYTLDAGKGTAHKLEQLVLKYYKAHVCIGLEYLDAITIEEVEAKAKELIFILKFKKQLKTFKY